MLVRGVAGNARRDFDEVKVAHSFLRYARGPTDRQTYE